MINTPLNYRKWYTCNIEILASLHISIIYINEHTCALILCIYLIFSKEKSNISESTFIYSKFSLIFMLFEKNMTYFYQHKIQTIDIIFLL